MNKRTKIGVTNTGYLRNSPDRFNDMNIIPSGNITMDGVNFPIIGMDNFGNKKIMYPGNNYKFEGDSVLEIPLKKEGGDMKDFRKQVSKNLRKDIKDRFSFTSSAPQNSGTQELSKFRNDKFLNSLNKNVQLSMVDDITDELINSVGMYQYGGGNENQLDYSAALPFIEAYNKNMKDAQDGINRFTASIGDFRNSFEMLPHVKLTKEGKAMFKDYKRDRGAYTEFGRTSGNPFEMRMDSSQIPMIPLRMYQDGGQQEQEQMIQILAAYFQQMGMEESAIQEAVEKFMSDDNFRNEISQRPDFQQFIEQVQGAGEQQPSEKEIMQQQMAEQQMMEEEVPMMRFGGGLPKYQTKGSVFNRDKFLEAERKRSELNRFKEPETPNTTRVTNTYIPNQEQIDNTQLNRIQNILNSFNPDAFYDRQVKSTRIPSNEFNSFINAYRDNDQKLISDFFSGNVSNTQPETASNTDDKTSNKTTDNKTSSDNTPSQQGNNPAGRTPKTTTEEAGSTDGDDKKTKGNISGGAEVTNTNTGTGTTTAQVGNNRLSVLTDARGNQFLYNPAMYGFLDGRQRRNGTWRRISFSPFPEHYFGNNQGQGRIITENPSAGVFGNRPGTFPAGTTNAGTPQFREINDPLNFIDYSRLSNRRDRLQNRMDTSNNPNEKGRLQRRISRLDNKLFMPSQSDEALNAYEYSNRRIDSLPILEVNQIPNKPIRNDIINTGIEEGVDPNLIALYQSILPKAQTGWEVDDTINMFTGLDRQSFEDLTNYYNLELNDINIAERNAAEAMLNPGWDIRNLLQSDRFRNYIEHDLGKNFDEYSSERFPNLYQRNNNNNPNEKDRQQRRISRLDNKLFMPLQSDEALNAYEHDRPQRRISKLDNKLFMPLQSDEALNAYEHDRRIDSLPILEVNQIPNTPIRNDIINTGIEGEVDPNLIALYQSILPKAQTGWEVNDTINMLPIRTVNRIPLRDMGDIRVGDNSGISRVDFRKTPNLRASADFGIAGIGALASVGNYLEAMENRRRANEGMVGNELFLYNDANNRGDYMANQGFFRPDDHVTETRGYQAFDYMAKYGGGLNRFQNGGEYYLSDQEIERLKNQGYNIEYLD